MAYRKDSNGYGHIFLVTETDTDDFHLAGDFILFSSSRQFLCSVFYLILHFEFHKTVAPYPIRISFLCKKKRYEIFSPTIENDFFLNVK
jgi:hypothetical protein